MGVFAVFQGMDIHEMRPFLVFVKHLCKYQEFCYRNSIGLRLLSIFFFSLKIWISVFWR